MPYEAETAMKNLIKIIIFSSFSYCHALAGIQLDWEYTVGENDFSPIGPSQIDPLMPPQHGITAIKVGPTGHTAVVLERAPYYYWDEGSNTSAEYDREVRFAILDPQGNRIWLSEDLNSQFDGVVEIKVQILSVMPDSATFGTAASLMEISPEVKIFSFNSSTSPQLSQLIVTDQRLAAKAISGGATGFDSALQGDTFTQNFIASCSSDGLIQMTGKAEFSGTSS